MQGKQIIIGVFSTKIEQPRPHEATLAQVGKDIVRAI